MATKARPRARERQEKHPKAGLPDHACPNCGSAMRERSGALRLPVNGEEIAVPGAAHLRCPKCHEVVLRLDQARKLRERALDTYRSRYGLLSADFYHCYRAGELEQTRDLIRWAGFYEAKQEREALYRQLVYEHLRELRRRSGIGALALDPAGA